MEFPNFLNSAHVPTDIPDIFIHEDYGVNTTYKIYEFGSNNFVHQYCKHDYYRVLIGSEETCFDTLKHAARYLYDQWYLCTPLTLNRFHAGQVVMYDGKVKGLKTLEQSLRHCVTTSSGSFAGMGPLTMKSDGVTGSGLGQHIGTRIYNTPLEPRIK